jgi:hypothetical protein
MNSDDLSRRVLGTGEEIYPVSRWRRRIEADDGGRYEWKREETTSEVNKKNGSDF